MTTRAAAPSDPWRRAFLRGRLFTSEGRLAVRRALGLPSLAVLDRDACLAWEDVFCVSCRMACPDDAIALDPQMRPSIDDAACTGCADCITACPADAMVMK